MKNGALFGVFIIEGTAKRAKQGGQRAVGGRERLSVEHTYDEPVTALRLVAQMLLGTLITWR